MLVVPMKWVPYLLVFGGLIRLFGLTTDYDITSAIVMFAIGGIWLYIRYSNNSKPSTEKTEESKSSLSE